ncbi:hypothetical protein ACFOPN_03365 [Xanthomonas hyacinthi]|uniref:Uncharacterized protein n=1 Tax=Xanthomonas hyacinthi TaxID=56455 RepID=A0A2S7EWS9_9XANT|nr:hypothetical protein Y886_13510 [Xanthomonas hyacinthi DSM 19077]PPU97614.1 hypothetical protein XhyaCFBP1156_09630 [Xanthomonas hyacinthi]
MRWIVIIGIGVMAGGREHPPPRLKTAQTRAAAGNAPPARGGAMSALAARHRAAQARAPPRRLSA